MPDMFDIIGVEVPPIGLALEDPERLAAMRQEQYEQLKHPLPGTELPEDNTFPGAPPLMPPPIESPTIPTLV
jgi:hypothetical protein